MIVDKHTQAKFIYNGNTYRLIEICWFKDNPLEMEPTVIFIDGNGTSQQINSGKGQVVFENPSPPDLGVVAVEKVKANDRFGG